MRHRVLGVGEILFTFTLGGVVVPASAPAQGVALRQLVQAPMPARAQSLASDANGRIWLTLQGANPSIGVIDASDCADSLQNCAPQEYVLPDEFEDVTPAFITVDRRGKVWFTGSNGAAGFIFSFDPETEAFETWEVPEELGVSPHDIAVGAYVWFTDTEIGLISLNPRTGAFAAEYLTPDDARAGTVAALGVSIDPSGGVWCTCGLDLVRIGWRVIGRLRQIVIREVLVRRVPDARKPHGVLADDANVAWVLDQHSLGLHRFDRSRDAFDSWDVPGAKFSIDPHWLVRRGPSVYFTGFAGVLGRFDVGQETFDAYLVSPSRAEVGTATGAFDVAIDRAGRVWFTEINAEMLTRLDIRRLPPPRIPPPIPDR